MQPRSDTRISPTSYTPIYLTPAELAALPPLPERAPRPVAAAPVSTETTEALVDRGRRDRTADAAAAEKIEDKKDAKKLLLTILGSAAAGAVVADIATKKPRQGNASPHSYRPPVEEVGRTQQARDRNVDSMVRRFEGQAPPPAANPQARFQRDARPQQGYVVPQRAPQYYEGNRRVVRYASPREIPPVIIASRELNRVEVQPLARSPYGYNPQAPRESRYSNVIPQNYSGADAYAVSYSVDPNSAMSQDDILFRQGSTDFSDAYSYDLVIDIAEAMNHPSLVNETFVIEGHASAEGDYGKNLLLSQERAERISRDLVYYGVNPERLMPVGYGEAEAAYPANAPEPYRRLDRRVMVFRMR